jgi:RsiW-degrading membrane proteinase PrsW (M82 family)
MNDKQIQQETKSVGSWSLEGVPELTGLSRQARQRVHAVCVRHHFLHARVTWWSAFAYAVFISCVSGFSALSEFVARLIGVQNSIWFLICGALIGAWVGAFLFSRMAISLVRAFYRETIEKELGK